MATRETLGSDDRCRDSPQPRSPWLLVLAALGVVYGDIGTSPLYAIRECFYGPHAIALTHGHVLGVLSLVFWALLLVISLKYLLLVLRADNKGEGGILALMAIACPAAKRERPRSVTWLLALLGIFGASLLYGDGVITPAISVLSAVEGLGVAAPVLQPVVVPLTLGILAGLFALQHRGTLRVGKLFGPITLLWFAAIGVLGALSVAQTPDVLLALNPLHAASFVLEARGFALATIGVVFLVVTGGEALYADMGHLGCTPIRRAWFLIVLPALLLNYFGQGALLLRDPGSAHNPFFLLAPPPLLYPLIALATLATIIASQAVITGAFSLTWQAVQMGYLPRVHVQHTSEHKIGQIYISSVNWLLFATCVGLVLAFGSSSALAGAYGVAVSTTMVITTLLVAAVMRKRWRWPVPVVFVIAAFFLVIDIAFWVPNLAKIVDGGWFPLAIGLLGLTVMTTWRTGRRILARRLLQRSDTIEQLIARLREEHPSRVPGTGVFLTGGTQWAPPALMRLLRHVRAVHEQLVLFTVVADDRAHVDSQEQLEVTEIAPQLYRVVARCGYMQRPHVPQLLARCAEYGLAADPETTTYVLGHESVLAKGHGGMARWRERLFALLVRNSGRATVYYGLPAGHVLEVGALIAI